MTECMTTDKCSSWTTFRFSVFDGVQILPYFAIVGISDSQYSNLTSVVCTGVPLSLILIGSTQMMVNKGL